MQKKTNDRRAEYLQRRAAGNTRSGAVKTLQQRSQSRPGAVVGESPRAVHGNVGARVGK